MRWQGVLLADARWTERLAIPARANRLRATGALLAHSGDSWFWLLGLGIVWLALPEWRAWTVRVAASVLILAILVLGIKFLIRRPRPQGEWGQIYRSTDPHSFPSGHAARAALLAALTLAWGPAWLAPVLVVWAPLVSLARVALGVHYLLDVVVGMGLGLIIGLAIGFGGPVILPVLLAR